VIPIHINVYPCSTYGDALRMGGIRIGVSGRREPIPGGCGKNFLFFTPRNTYADPAPRDGGCM
jgi:hypothetical protein